jgi:hypothetical protein
MNLKKKPQVKRVKPLRDTLQIKALMFRQASCQKKGEKRYDLSLV